MKLCKETMTASYNWISFSPEKRGESDFDYYTKLLASDLEALGENKGNYEQKFIEKVMTIYHRLSRCASPMIAGPAKFPFSSNQKKNQAHRNAEDDFTHWRAKYFKAVNRQRTLSPEEEIDKALAEIDAMETKKEIFKEANKLKTVEERKSHLAEHGYDPEKYIHAFTGDKIPSFSLTSITTKIRERKKKLDVMKARIERKETFEPIEFNGGRAYIDNDRLVIAHDVKPPREVIDVIKSNGFRYSPKTQTWVRKHTENAIWTLKQYVLPKLA